MKIIYYDGSVLTGNTIAIYGDEMIIDDYRIAKIYEVDRIEED